MSQDETDEHLPLAWFFLSEGERAVICSAWEVTG